MDSFLPKPLFAAAVLEEFKSALKRKDIPAKKQQAGLNAHLSKPVQPETLFETLESLIRPGSDIREEESVKTWIPIKGCL